jgi:hypothetical protein
MVLTLLILWNLLWAPVEVGGREDPPRGYQIEQPFDAGRDALDNLEAE